MEKTVFCFQFSRGFTWTNRSTFVLLSCLRVQYQREQPIGVQVLPTNHGRLHLVELGVNKLEDLVGVTLGPKGRNVVLYGKYGAPKIIKDGVTVAKEVVAAGANPVLITRGIEKTAKALVAEIYL